MSAMEKLLSSFPILGHVVVELAFALLILIVGWAVSSLVGRSIRRLADGSKRIDPTIVPILYTVTVWGIRVFVIVAVLARLGVQTASLIAVLGAAGLAIGLALQGTLQNIAAGRSEEHTSELQSLIRISYSVFC